MCTLQVVVVWVLCHPSVDEGPCEIVHRILLVLYGLGHYLSVEVIMKEVVQMGLKREQNGNQIIRE